MLTFKQIFQKKRFFSQPVVTTSSFLCIQCKGKNLHKGDNQMLESLKNQGQDLLTLESLPQTTAIEIAIAQCAAEDSEKYHQMRKKMLPLLQNQTGFLAWRAFRSQTREGIMLDLLYWENAEDCHKAGITLQNSETGKEFFALMKQTLIFEMFERQPL
ncbi:hypothetical protein LEP1GSC017_0333 [Leptospira meyeri serovar Hardjo str. Went 5]|nr:hypothetical protein LEP1GSC017_0333 [Leptospira meyeri serovar Hardjo str. Went 5]